MLCHNFENGFLIHIHEHVLLFLFSVGTFGKSEHIILYYPNKSNAFASFPKIDENFRCTAHLRMYVYMYGDMYDRIV